MAAVRTKKRAVPVSDRLINRELSFLDYDARVLGVATDPTQPLLERVRFCAIFSAMLDEFFMTRVAGLTGQAAAGVVVRSPDGRTAQQTIAEARTRVLELYGEQSRIWSHELCPALAAEGIAISGVEELAHDELRQLEHLYEEEIYPVLTPLAVGPGQPFPYISALSVSLAVFARDPESGEERFARVKVPEGLPRFLSIGDGGRIVPLEQVLMHFLPSLFPGMEIVERSVFRVTRDADFEVSDEADDLLEAVELELRRRRFGEVTRLEVSSSMSQALRWRLQQGLRVPDELVYPVKGMIDLEDANELTKLDRPDLKLDPWVPVPRPPLANIEAEEQFALIRAGDVLVHHPYDSFAASFESFANECASDPNVIALKSTVYRTSDESPLVPALIEASENGKQSVCLVEIKARGDERRNIECAKVSELEVIVHGTGDDSPLVPALIEASENGKQSVCLVEIKARGDERRNIEWSRALEQAGVHVAYGFPSLKIHAKMTLVVRREGGVLRRYVHIGTGNYNGVTARGYEDFGLFTADEDIAADVADLFNYVTGFGRPAHFRKLLVAPFTLRQRLIEEIRDVAAAARAGRKARIRMKVNGLTHTEVIDELYAASEAGARIELVVRGMCSLRPGVPGLSENIRVRSVLGRFLEHSRLFFFEAGERSAFYLGSSDMMPRNLDHRIEVVMPVEDVAVQSELAATLDTLLADNASSWELQSDGTWERVRPKKDDRVRSAQATMMRRARRRVSLARSR